jgi:hypothetical protein
MQRSLHKRFSLHAESGLRFVANKPHLGLPHRRPGAPSCARWHFFSRALTPETPGRLSACHVQGPGCQLSAFEAGRKPNTAQRCAG